MVLFSIFHYNTHFTPVIGFIFQHYDVAVSHFLNRRKNCLQKVKCQFLILCSLQKESLPGKKNFSQFVVTFPAPFPKLIRLSAKIQSGTPQGKSFSFYGPIVKPQSGKYCIRCGNWVLTRQDHPRGNTRLPSRTCRSRLSGYPKARSISTAMRRRGFLSLAYVAQYRVRMFNCFKLDSPPPVIDRLETRFYWLAP